MTQIAPSDALHQAVAETIAVLFPLRTSVGEIADGVIADIRDHPELVWRLLPEADRAAIRALADAAEEITECLDKPAAWKLDFCSATRLDRAQRALPSYVTEGSE